MTEFANWLQESRSYLYPTKEMYVSLQMSMDKQKQLTHGDEYRRYFYYPKVLGLCLESIQARDDMKENIDLVAAFNFLCTKVDQIEDVTNSKAESDVLINSAKL